MQTVAVIGQKGGTGKTTLVTLLAVAAEMAGQVTAAIDVDPQVSLCKWSDRRQSDSPIVVDSQPGRLPHALDAARRRGVDLAIIDTAGRAEQATVIAAKASDLVILPFQPSVADLDTLEGTLDLLRLAGGRVRLAVLNRVRAQGQREEEAATWLKGADVPVCPVMLGDRITYQDAYAAGQAPMEYAPGSKASVEGRQLYVVVRRVLDEIKKARNHEQKSSSDQRRHGQRGRGSQRKPARSAAGA
ncbi:MAG: ParA family protein [Alphaproteobacteria bacterium]|nr:ParA family protein [Alphaproteobacteria bacterium]